MVFWKLLPTQFNNLILIREKKAKIWGLHFVLSLPHTFCSFPASYILFFPCLIHFVLSPASYILFFPCLIHFVLSLSHTFCSFPASDILLYKTHKVSIFQNHVNKLYCTFDATLLYPTNPLFLNFEDYFYVVVYTYCTVHYIHNVLLVLLKLTNNLTVLSRC